MKNKGLFIYLSVGGGEVRGRVYELYSSISFYGGIGMFGDLDIVKYMLMGKGEGMEINNMRIYIWES